MIFKRRGGEWETSPYKQFFQVSALGELEKIGACEGTQAVLAILPRSGFNAPAFYRKWQDFLRGTYP